MKRVGKLVMAARRKMMTPAGVPIRRKPPPAAGAAPVEPAPKPKPLAPAKAKELA